jgi:hypothetical protein
VLYDRFGLVPKLRQTVKSQTSANGELTHGIVSTEIHKRNETGCDTAAGNGLVGRRSGLRLKSTPTCCTGGGRNSGMARATPFLEPVQRLSTEPRSAPIGTEPCAAELHAKPSYRVAWRECHYRQKKRRLLEFQHNPRACRGVSTFGRSNLNTRWLATLSPSLQIQIR